MTLRSPALAALVSLFLVLAQIGGCDDSMLPDFPTSEQVDLYIPEGMRSCPDMPDSPGENATKKQTAEYMLALYNVAKACGYANKQADQLYGKYRVQIERLTKQ